MAWKLAPALAALISDVNQEWPNRSKTYDGTIGDAAHAARKSEHNPNRDPSDDVPDGYVTAADITATGINVTRLIETLVADERVWYVIHNRVIRSRTYGFKSQAYTGADPHLHHVHVSLVQRAAQCNDTTRWALAPGKPETPYQRLARIAAQRLRKIRRLRKRLG